MLHAELMSGSYDAINDDKRCVTEYFPTSLMRYGTESLPERQLAFLQPIRQA